MSVLSKDGFISVEELNQAGEKPLLVPFSGSTLELTYDQSGYTPELERQMNEQLKDGRAGAMLSSMLMTVLRSWKVMNDRPRTLKARPGRHRKDEYGRTMKDDQGHPLPEEDLVLEQGPLPLNERVLDQVIGIFAQGKIVRAIMDDQRPNEETSPMPVDTF